jgi:alkylhydroperoxidase/carboxymuconolactone decarboxylase family protein YurZ
MPDQPTAPSEISTILHRDKLKSLRTAYSDESADELLRDETPKLYGPAAAYFGAVVETYYLPAAAKFDANGERTTLDPLDRQRVVIALQAATGQEAPLAIHIYIGLMLGLTVDEIANILLLTGVYSGVPNFFTGLGTLATTLLVLKGVAATRDHSCNAVLTAIRATWRQPIAGMIQPQPASPVPSPVPAAATPAPTPTPPPTDTL